MFLFYYRKSRYRNSVRRGTTVAYKYIQYIEKKISIVHPRLLEEFWYVCWVCIFSYVHWILWHQLGDSWLGNLLVFLLVNLVFWGILLLVPNQNLKITLSFFYSTFLYELGWCVINLCNQFTRFNAWNFGNSADAKFFNCHFNYCGTCCSWSYSC